MVSSIHDHNPSPNGLISDPVGTRGVAFPDGEHKYPNTSRSTGIEVQPTLTQEDRELAAAGYNHLERQKNSKEPDSAVGQANFDIQEHHLPLHSLGDALETSIDTKDGALSFGLTSQEASVRLKRDGANILTPPRKKSALRKVRFMLFSQLQAVSDVSLLQFFDRLMTMFNILLMVAGILEYVLLGIDFKVSP